MITQMMKSWTIHGLVVLRMDMRLSWLPTYASKMRDVLLAGEQTRDSDAPSVTVNWVSKLELEGTREIEPGIRVSPTAIVDEQYGVRFEIARGRHITLSCIDSAMEWLEWSLLLALLAAGKAMVHGASLEKDGRAILFPSWGGVGKTAIVARFVESFGWRFLGDDLCRVEYSRFRSRWCSIHTIDRSSRRFFQLARGQ